MSILDLGTGPSRPSVGKKSTRVFLGFGLLIAVIGIGSTFASTISINDQQDIEFGQGVQKSIFCGGSESITVTPISEFANADDSGFFGFTGLRVSEIPDACSDRNFVIKAYAERGATPLKLSERDGGFANLANVWWTNGCEDENENCRLRDYAGALDGGFALVSTDLEDYEMEYQFIEVEGMEDSFILSFGGTVLSSDAVKKIVIETKNDSFGLDQCKLSGPCSAPLS